MNFLIGSISALIAQTLAPVLLMAEGLPEYSIVQSQTCNEGYSPITSTWQDCKQAAVDLELDVSFIDIEVELVDSYPWKEGPQGCFGVEDDDGMY